MCSAARSILHGVGKRPHLVSLSHGAYELNRHGVSSARTSAPACRDCHNVHRMAAGSFPATFSRLRQWASLKGEASFTVVTRQL